MSTKNTKHSPAAETAKAIIHLAAALKAPRITEAAARLADHARDSGWTHEDYLAAVLEREVAARNASGARLRIRAAGFPAVKTLEDFDFDHQPAARTPTHALASGAYLSEHRNVVLLGPTVIRGLASVGVRFGWSGCCCDRCNDSGGAGGGVASTGEFSAEVEVLPVGLFQRGP